MLTLQTIETKSRSKLQKSNQVKSSVKQMDTKIRKITTSYTAINNTISSIFSDIIVKILLLTCLVICLLFSSHVIDAQTHKQRPNKQADLHAPQAKFLSDSIKVGENVKLSVVWRHLSEKEVFFPDSTHNFEPFEFISKRAFPTKTTGLSTDSVIYELTTFEMDSILRFSMPIFVLNEKDTTVVPTNEVELFIIPTVLNLPDSLKIIENTNLQNLDTDFNYWYWATGLVMLAIIFGVLFYVFGGRIRKNFRLGRMRKQYQRFITDFDRALLRYDQLSSTEQGLSIWKSYLENLQNIPFTTYTSKEIADLVPDKHLTESLKDIDRAIYGNRINEQTKEALLILKTYAENIYETKIKEVQNV